MPRVRHRADAVDSRIPGLVAPGVETAHRSDDMASRRVGGVAGRPHPVAVGSHRAEPEPGEQVMPAGAPPGELRILVEMNSADLRIGAVNDALDLGELAASSGARFTLCGPITAQLQQEAERRGIGTLYASSRQFSRRGLPLYIVDVLRWVARLLRLSPDVVHLNYPGYGPSLACA